MATENDVTLLAVRRLVAEELHLVGQEIEDSHQPGQALRLAEVAAALDEVDRLLARRLRSRRPTAALTTSEDRP